MEALSAGLPITADDLAAWDGVSNYKVLI